MYKPKLITVTGIRSNTLRQMLEHYKEYVSEIHVILYNALDRSNKNEYNICKEIAEEFGCIIYDKTERIYNWEAVTKFYNEIKFKFPDDWWIVSDDDELQLYQTSIDYIIEDSEEHGWEFVTGGFVDRIGENGKFPEITQSDDLWNLFPIASFFRNPICGADANKVTMMKGKIEITNGQHYVKIGGQTTWRWQGWNHPLRYPIHKNFTQVHHFKWDKSVVDRIKDVSTINTPYSYSDEYRKMYEYIIKNEGKINLAEFKNWTCKSDKNFIHYPHWKKITNKILTI